MRTQTQCKAFKDIGKKCVQRIDFSKAAAIPLQVYHFNKSGPFLQVFFNEFTIFSSLWLLLGKNSNTVMQYERTRFLKKKKKNCRVIENHFKLSPFIS